MAGEPGGGANIHMGLIVLDGPRADCGGMNIRRTHNHLNAFSQAPFTCDLWAQQTEDRIRGSQVRQFRAVNGRELNQFILILYVSDVAIIRQPVKRNGIEGGGDVTGQSQAEIAYWFEKLIRA